MKYQIRNPLYQCLGLLIAIWLWSLGSDLTAYANEIQLEIYQKFATGQLLAGTSGNQLGLYAVNSGTTIAYNVTISDTVDSRLTVTDVDCGTGVDESQGQVVLCTYPMLPALGGSATTIISYDIAQNIESGLVTNNATASAVPTDITDEREPFFAHTSREIALISQNELVLEQHFADEQITAENDVRHTFTLIAGNSNGTDVHNVQVSSQVDERLQLSIVDCGMGINNSQGQHIDCTYITIGAGSSALITATYAITGSTEPGLVSTYATATDNAGGLAEAWGQVIINRKVELALRHRFADRKVSPGSQDHHFTIMASNYGPSNSGNVQVENRVDDRLILTNVDCGPGIDQSEGQQVLCLYDTLLANAPPVTIDVTYGVQEGVQPGVVINSVTATDEDQNSMALSHNVEIIGEQRPIMATMHFSPTDVMAGSDENLFTITASNHSDQDAQQFQIASDVDPRLSVKNVDCGSGDDSSQGQQVRCLYEALSANSTTAMSVTYGVDSSVEYAQVSNSATIFVGEEAVFTSTGTVNILYDMKLDLENRFYDQVVIAGSTGRILNITAHNQGLSDLHTVQVTNTLDSSLIVTVVDCGTGSNQSNGQDIDCTYPSIAGGHSAVITVTYDVAQEVAVDAITTLAYAHDELGSRADSMDMITVMEALELDVRQRFAHNTVEPGATAETITIFVGNPNKYDLHDIEISNDVDARLIVTGVDCGNGQNNSQRQRVSCVYETLSANGELMITVNYAVPTDAWSSTVPNRVDVFFAGNNHIQMDASVQIIDSDGEPTPTNTPFFVAESVATSVNMPTTTSTAQATATPTATPIGAKLTLAVNFPDEQVIIGSSDHEMTLTLRNTGAADAKRVQITDHFAPELLVLSAECGSGVPAHRGQTVECLYDSIPSGGDVTIIVRYVVAEGAVPNVISNTASAQDSVGNFIKASSDITLIPDPTAPPIEVESGLGSVQVELNIKNYFVDTTIVAGDGAHQLFLTVDNRGNGDAHAVQIIDVMDERLQVLAVDCNVGINQSEGQHVNCLYSTLAAQSSKQITITYETDEYLSSSMILNEASVEDRQGNNAQSRVMLQVMQDVQLSLVQNFGEQPLRAGDEYTFTVALGNLGDVDGTDVQLNSVVNSRFAIEAVHCGATGVKNINTSSGQAISCFYPVLAGHEIARVTVTYMIPADVPGGQVSSMISAQDGQNHNVVEVVELEIIQENPGSLKSDQENSVPWVSPVAAEEYMIFLPGIFQE